METVVHKFSFPRFADEAVFEMNSQATILHADIQNDVVCLWARVQRDSINNKVAERRFIIRGTGEAIPSGLYQHVSTFMVNGGEFVFHVFEDWGDSFNPIVDDIAKVLVDCS